MFSAHHSPYYLPSLSFFSPQQYISAAQYHPLANPPSQHSHLHPHPHQHPHSQPPQHHHQPQHSAYPHHPHHQQQQPHHHHHPQQPHVLAGPIRTEPLTRKRPKYTRSKTGCLTCRVKKIKCDETKPTCTRCAHGQRECTWPENVPSRKKPPPKKQAEQAADEGSPSANSDNASPGSSSTTPAAREPSPSRKSPLCNMGPSDNNSMSSRRTHSEPNTATASPMGSPIEPHPALSRRPRYDSIHNPMSERSATMTMHYPPYYNSSQQPIHHNNNNNSIPPYPTSSTQPIRQHSYSSISPPSVSPASFHHHSPTSEYPSYTNSPISNGHGHHTPSTAGSSLSRHDLPSIQTSQSRLSNIPVDPSQHNIGTWHTTPMMSSSVNTIEPFYRTVQDRSLVGRSPTSSYPS